jgi:hypothetical protein
MDKQQAALAYLGTDWHAGPDLPDHVLEVITPLREAGLVEREFGDMGPPETSETVDGFNVHIGACWWFRAVPQEQPSE